MSLFKRYATTPSLMSTPKEKSELYRDRLQLVKQRVLRDEHFDQSSSSQAMDPDSNSYLKVSPNTTQIKHPSTSPLFI